MRLPSSARRASSKAATSASIASSSSLSRSLTGTIAATRFPLRVTIVRFPVKRLSSIVTPNSSRCSRCILRHAGCHRCSRDPSIPHGLQETPRARGAFASAWEGTAWCTPWIKANSSSGFLPSVRAEVSIKNRDAHVNRGVPTFSVWSAFTLRSIPHPSSSTQSRPQ